MKITKTKGNFEFALDIQTPPEKVFGPPPKKKKKTKTSHLRRYDWMPSVFCLLCFHFFVVSCCFFRQRHR